MAKDIVKKTTLEKAEENLTLIRGALVSLATLVDGLKRPDSMGRCLVDLKKVGDAIGDMKSGLEDKVKILLEQKGEQVTEKGSRSYTENGVTLTMRPTRTGLDPRKLEQLLRMKKLKLTEYMDEEVTVKYKVNQSKLDMQAAAKKLTDAELEQCKYDESWSLQPTKVEE